MASRKTPVFETLHFLQTVSFRSRQNHPELYTVLPKSVRDLKSLSRSAGLSGGLLEPKWLSMRREWAALARSCTAIVELLQLSCLNFQPSKILRRTASEIVVRTHGCNNPQMEGVSAVFWYDPSSMIGFEFPHPQAVDTHPWCCRARLSFGQQKGIRYRRTLANYTGPKRFGRVS